MAAPVVGAGARPRRPQRMGVDAGAALDRHAIHMTLALLGLTLAWCTAPPSSPPNGIVRLVDLAVPFVNPSDPVGVGAGALSLELLLAGALSVPLRKRLGHARSAGRARPDVRGVHPAHRARPHLRVRRGPTWLWASVLAACLVVVRSCGSGRPVWRGGRGRAARHGRSTVAVRRPSPSTSTPHAAEALRVLRARGPRRVPPPGQRPPGLPGTRAGRRRRERDPCRRGVPREGHLAAPAADHGAHARHRSHPAAHARDRRARTAEATLRTGGSRPCRSGPPPTTQGRTPRIARSAPPPRAAEGGSLTSTPATGVVVRRGQARRRVVVVGGGRAGVAAVEELLRAGLRRRAPSCCTTRAHLAVRPSCAKGLPPGTAARGRPDRAVPAVLMAARVPRADRARPRSARRAHRHRRRPVRLRPARRRHRSRARRPRPAGPWTSPACTCCTG